MFSDLIPIVAQLLSLIFGLARHRSAKRQQQQDGSGVPNVENVSRSSSILVGDDNSMRSSFFDPPIDEYTRVNSAIIPIPQNVNSVLRITQDLHNQKLKKKNEKSLQDRNESGSKSVDSNSFLKGIYEEVPAEATRIGISTSRTQQEINRSDF